jgi:L-fucose isomerase-like protein
LFRDHPGIGVTACLAASGAVPTSCTGDLPTAWLLAELARHGHEALYCEPYTVDDDRGAVFLGNCGIGAAGLARAGSWTTQPSQYYPGRHGRGASVAMAVRPGPATYLAVRPGGGGWRVVAIEGTVLPDMVDGFGGAQAFFRPATHTPRAMVTTLAELGVVHHGALIRGHLAEKWHSIERPKESD